LRHQDDFKLPDKRATFFRTMSIISTLAVYLQGFVCLLLYAFFVRSSKSVPPFFDDFSTPPLLTFFSSAGLFERSAVGVSSAGRWFLISVIAIGVLDTP
jgi:hypothetical protein